MMRRITLGLAVFLIAMFSAVLSGQAASTGSRHSARDQRSSRENAKAEDLQNV